MAGSMVKGSFIWDPAKEAINKLRHGGRIRIIGAGYWRKGRKFYEETAEQKT